MYTNQYPTEYKDFVKRPGRDWKLFIPPFSTNYIMNFKFESVLGDSKTFSIGANSTSFVDIEVYHPDNNEDMFKNTTLEPKLQLRTEVMINNVLTEVWQDVPLGKFIVDEISRQNTSNISIRAVDKMSHDNYGNKVYNCQLNFPISIKNVLNDVAGYMSCNIENINDIPNINLKEKKKINGKTLRQVLSYIATLYGGFVKINRKGNIEFFKINDTGISYDTNGGIKKITEGEPIMEINGIKCQISPNEFITVGSVNETNTVEMINYDMTKESLSSIFDEYKGSRYYSLVYDGMIDPAIEVGDLLTVTNMQGNDKKILNQTISWEFMGGPQGEYQCDYNLEDADWDTAEDQNERLDELETDLEDTKDNYDDRLELLEKQIENITGGSDSGIDPSDIDNRLSNIESRLATLEQQIQKCINCDYVNGSGSSSIIPSGISGLADITIKKGYSRTVTAAISPSNADKTVTWSINDSSIASITPSGVACTIKGIKKGQTTVTCTSKKASMVSSTFKVTVTDDNMLENTNLLDCGNPRELTFDGSNLISISSSDSNSWQYCSNEYLDTIDTELKNTALFTANRIKGLFYKIDTSNFNHNANDYNIYTVNITVKCNYIWNNGTTNQVSAEPNIGIGCHNVYIFNKCEDSYTTEYSGRIKLNKVSSSISGNNITQQFRLELCGAFMNYYNTPNIYIFIGCVNSNNGVRYKDSTGSIISDTNVSPTYVCVNSQFSSLNISHNIIN